MGIRLVMKGIGKGSLFRYGRILGIHKPWDSELGKAKDPFINTRTLARLSNSSNIEVRKAVAINLAHLTERDHSQTLPLNALNREENAGKVPVAADLDKIVIRLANNGYMGILYEDTISQDQNEQICKKIRHAQREVFIILNNFRKPNMALTKDIIQALNTRDEIPRVLIVPPVFKDPEDLLATIDEQISSISKGSCRLRDCFSDIILQAPDTGLSKIAEIGSGGQILPFKVYPSMEKIKSISQKLNMNISTTLIVDPRKAKQGQLIFNVLEVESAIKKLFIERLKLGAKSERLDRLDPEIQYQPLTDFPAITGPSFEEIVSYLPAKEYNLKVPNNDHSPEAVSQIIWDFLNSHAGEIRHSGSMPSYGKNEKGYMDQIRECVIRGLPVELIFMNFSPKFASPLISGHSLLPDLSNLLALQHLIDIVKAVKKIYPPGIKFIVLEEGRLYQDLGQFTDQEVKECFEQLKYFSKTIENKAGVSGAIDIIDVQKLINDTGTAFEDELILEERKLEQVYASGEDITLKQAIDDWRAAFAMNIIDLNRLMKEHGEEHRAFSLGQWLKIIHHSPPSDESLKRVRDYVDRKTLKSAIDYFAFRKLKYSGGKEKRGILTNYPRAIPFTVRADHLRLSLQLIPGTPSYPHHGITVWTGKKWEITGLMDLARYPGQFVGVTLAGKNDPGRDPFYYLLKDADCPAFSRPVGAYKYDAPFPQILARKGFRMLEDWSDRGSMDSRLFVAEDKSGKKVIIKYSSVAGFEGNGRPVLRKEADRLKSISKEMNALSGHIFPEIIEYLDDSDATYYVMTYFPDTNTIGSHLANFTNGEPYSREANRLVNKLLDIMSGKIYSKGMEPAPLNYISRSHLDRLREGVQLLIDNKSATFMDFLKDNKFEIGGVAHKDITEFFKKVFNNETVTINGFEFLNFPKILQVIADHEEEINRDLNPSMVPKITHGDLHFRNILRNSADEMFLVDPYGKRPVNAVETELGRLMLSYFADFLTNGKYDMNVKASADGKLDLSLFYNGDNEGLILGQSNARDSMLGIYKDHPEIYKWIKDTKNWQAHVLLIEAIHIFAVAASKFSSTDPKGKLTLACYTTGLVLFNKVLADMGLIDRKYGRISSPMKFFVPGGYDFQKVRFMQQIAPEVEGPKMEKTLDLIIEFLKKIGKHGQDKDSYLEMWRSFKAHGCDDITVDPQILDLETHKVMLLTLKDGQKIGVRMVPGEYADHIKPLEILYIKGGAKLELINADDALKMWQNINFPDKTYAPDLFKGNSEKELFESLRNASPVSVGGKSYKVVDLLGFGKESKVFKAVDVGTGKEMALKAGLTCLENETRDMAEITSILKHTEFAKYLPFYESFDKEKNIIVMELIKGRPLGEYITQKSGARKRPEQPLLLFSNTIIDICLLKERYNICYGQFNLQNILMDNKGNSRFIDPSYPLPRDRYDLLQIIRAGAIMLEEFYGLRDNEYPSKVKGAVSLNELKAVRASDSIWKRLEEADLPVSPMINAKIKYIIRKCLMPAARLGTLGELRNEFEELRSIIYAYHPELSPAVIHAGKVMTIPQIRLKDQISKRYKALALDYNNTIENDGITDKCLMRKIAGLLDQNIHVAIITGKRATWINTFAEEIRPFLPDNKKLDHLHFYASEGAMGCNAGTRELYYRYPFDRDLMTKAAKVIKREYPHLDFNLNYRTDGYRMNFDPLMDVNRLNELFKSCGLPVAALTSGTSIDIVPVGINKGVGLSDFASRLGISIDDIAKIADKGQKYGNDNSLLSGSGSFSVDKYEPDSDQVSLAETLGLKGVCATGWLLDNLNFHKTGSAHRATMLADIVKEQRWPSRYANGSLWSDRRFVLAAVKKHGWTLKYADDPLRKDREIVLAAVKQFGLALQYADKCLRKDKEIVVGAVKANNLAFQYADESLKKDRDFVIAIVKENGRALEHADRALRNDREIILTAAISKHKWPAEYANESPWNDKAFVLSQVKIDGSALECASEPLKRDREIVLTAVKQYRWALRYADGSLRKDKEIVLAGIRRHGWDLISADKSLWSDKDFVLGILEENGEAFRFADESLRKNRDFVLAAVKVNGWALKYAADPLKNDKEIVLAAVKSNGAALQFADALLRKDKDIVIAAVTENYEAIKYAGEALKGDKKILDAAGIESETIYGSKTRPITEKSLLSVPNSCEDPFSAANQSLNNVAVAWSGGKDGCLALYRVMKDRNNRLACLLNFTSRQSTRVSFHEIPPKLLQMQVEALGVPLLQGETTPDGYREEYKAAVSSLVIPYEINTMVFGDIYVDEHKKWVEEVCEDAGIRAVEPLWNENTENLLREIIDAGFTAYIVSAKDGLIDKKWVGKKIDNEFLDYLKQKGLDPCGEYGEYHSFVADGPIFRRKIELLNANIVKRGKYWVLNIKKYISKAKE